MKIVYMTYGIHYPGGMERVLSVKSNYLADNLRHDVYIVITDGKNRKPFFKFSDRIKVIDLGINYRDLSNMNRVKKVIPYLKKFYLHKKKLRNLLFEIRPDVCISMFQYEADILWDIKDGSKKILESHFCRVVDLLRNKDSNWFPKLIGNYLYKRNSRIASKYDCLVTLTNDDLMRYTDVNNKCCISNPLTIRDITPPHSGVNDKWDSKKIILAVGRVSYQKGFDQLVSIWNRLEPLHPAWKLHIYGSQGDTMYFKGISKLIEKMNRKNIHLYPPTDNIESIYQNSDILVVTSRYEGFNLSIIEGMSLGLPVVAFDCPCGPGEIIQHNINGVLVPLDDMDRFAESLESLMIDDARRISMGREAVKRAQAYSKEKIMNKWTCLFQNLLDNR